MRAVLGLVALLAVLGLAMAFTKPTEADFEAALETQLLARIDAADPGQATDPAEALLTATCKLGRDDCVRLIRALISLDYEDRVLYSRARLSLGDVESATCTGVLTRILCRESR